MEKETHLKLERLDKSLHCDELEGLLCIGAVILGSPGSASKPNIELGATPTGKLYNKVQRVSQRVKVCGRVWYQPIVWD